MKKREKWKLSRGALKEGNRPEVLLQFHGFSLGFRGFQEILAVEVAHLFGRIPAGIRRGKRGK